MAISASYPLLLILAALMVVDFRQTVIGIWAYKMVETQAVVKSIIDRFGVRGLASYQCAWFGLVCAIVIAFPSQWGAPLIVIASVASSIAENSRCLRERRRSWGRYTYRFASRMSLSQ